VPTAALEIGKTAGTGIGVSIFENGNAAFSGIVTVGGNLNVTGDIVYDEVNGRNLNISGVATVADLGVTGLSTAENFRVGYGASIHEHGGAAFAGIITANQGLRVFTDSGNSDPDSATNYISVGESQDLKVYHNGGTNYIAARDGDIQIRSDTFQLVSDDTAGRAIYLDNGNSLLELGFDGTDAVKVRATGTEFTKNITVSTGATIQTNGAAAFAGIVTANGGLVVGANGTLGSTAIGATITTNGNAAFVGIVTAAAFKGDGSGLSNLPASVSLSGSTDNTVVTVTGSNAMQGEANLTFDGSKLNVGSGVATVMTDGNAAFAGIVTAGRGFNIGIVSAGFTVARNVGISSLNFIGAGNTFLYNSTTRQLDISISGSGGGGGVSETSTSVSSTSATACGSFDKTEKRSAAVLAQITQGSAYQIGRYLLIHDGTTVTTIEESAIATGSMLGTFEGVINGDDVEFRVTMSSSSSATVITKIDSISI